MQSQVSVNFENSPPIRIDISQQPAMERDVWRITY